MRSSSWDSAGARSYFLLRGGHGAHPPRRPDSPLGDTTRYRAQDEVARNSGGHGHLARRRAPWNRAVPGIPRRRCIPTASPPTRIGNLLTRESLGAAAPSDRTLLAGNQHHSAPPAAATPHSPAPRGRSTAPSSWTPSSAIVTQQFWTAMAPGRLGLGGGNRLWPVARNGGRGRRSLAPAALRSAPASSPACGCAVPGSALRPGAGAGPACPLLCPLLPFLLQRRPLPPRVLGLVATFPG